MLRTELGFEQTNRVRGTDTEFALTHFNTIFDNYPVTSGVIYLIKTVRSQRK